KARDPPREILLHTGGHSLLREPGSIFHAQSVAVVCSVCLTSCIRLSRLAKSGSERDYLMPKFLLEATYTAERHNGLAKEKASGRKAAVTQAVKKLGGKLDAIYFCLGENDVILIVDLPDHVSFFFQAEDGIRYWSVTGVQTCALPI